MERRLRGDRMFQDTAWEWLDELEKEGRLEGLDEEGRRALGRDYARRIEEFFVAEVTRQLAPMGKVADFERMLLWDTQYTHKFLNQTIPGYPSFKMEILDRARREILGK
ncbi:MAG TPA: hypothetical protein PK175_10785 [Syntrophales bacterium]|nr:hypothetical protein [Syntrophales bacterium]HQI36267.1 hypothetical protein [Syntrophales bacterium]HRR48294.1 hypothetical protein [Syntrophales bacterium]